MAIFESISIGFSIAAIPGPIFFEIVRRVLTKNFWSGISTSIGAFIGYSMILLTIFFGISAFLTSTIAEIILFIIGGSILVWLGVRALRLKKEKVEKSYKNKISSKSSVLVGMSIAVSSPIVIGFWISLSGSYLAQFSKTLAFLNIFCITLGFVLFHLLLASFVQITRHKIPSKHILILSRIFGVILIGYGLNFYYNLWQILK